MFQLTLTKAAVAYLIATIKRLSNTLAQCRATCGRIFVGDKISTSLLIDINNLRRHSRYPIEQWAGISMPWLNILQDEFLAGIFRCVVG
jgi:hypothetical protein